MRITWIVPPRYSNIYILPGFATFRLIPPTNSNCESHQSFASSFCYHHVEPTRTNKKNRAFHTDVLSMMLGPWLILRMAYFSCTYLFELGSRMPYILNDKGYTAFGQCSFLYSIPCCYPSVMVQGDCWMFVALKDSNKSCSEIKSSTQLGFIFLP